VNDGVPVLSPVQRLQLLRATRTVAMVGASSNKARASNFVATYLLGSTDYTVWFVNPNEREILGHRVYASLADLPEAPDIVDVFRKAADLPDVATDAVAVGAKVFWAQLGLWSDDAAQIAAAGGLAVVMNRCLKIEHARFAGGLHLAGFDTGVLDSRRGHLLDGRRPTPVADRS
jgi:predicted CoA-binding protein